ncbi:MAG: Holliday junction branch migration protein RuvA [Kiritimatiellae bacterium]|nr:Holliday junction branch migration protein RuvA [Kiritimatiellia bacterium]
MITFLDGILVEKTPTRVVLNVGGVGYEVFVPLSSFDRLGAPQQTCHLLTYDYIREDQHSLFGFVSVAERKLFVLLMSVSGIGPKLALSALSSLTVRDITGAIAGGDVKLLGSVSGIGKKIAERMVVELRDKISAAEGLELAASSPADFGGDHRMRDSVLALVSLGYKQADAQKLVTAVLAGGKPDLSVEDIVRKALTR